MMNSRRLQSLRPAGGNGFVGCLQQSAYEPILTKTAGKMNRIAFRLVLGWRVRRISYGLVGAAAGEIAKVRNVFQPCGVFFAPNSP
jgi:hypothetical protein